MRRHIENDGSGCLDADLTWKHSIVVYVEVNKAHDDPDGGEPPWYARTALSSSSCREIRAAADTDRLQLLPILCHG